MKAIIALLALVALPVAAVEGIAWTSAVAVKHRTQRPAVPDDALRQPSYEDAREAANAVGLASVQDGASIAQSMDIADRQMNKAGWDSFGNNLWRTGPHSADIYLDLRGYAAANSLTGATYAATLYCPSAVAMAENEAASRTGVAINTETVFKVRIQALTLNHVWRCWIRVVATSANDAEDGEALDAMLPVNVEFTFN